MGERLSVLALEPWYGGSHKAFLDGLVSHSRHRIHPITMPARSWKWRMQGGAVSLASKVMKHVASGWIPDLILASDMVNLPSFLALTRDILPDVPVILFMHENQLTYPLREGEERDLSYAWINYLSCISADHVVFNSEFHRREFLDELPAFLKAFPDYRHSSNVGKIVDRSTVVHLGIDAESLDEDAVMAAPISSSSAEPTLILWNQRWEYDRNPSAFFRLIDRLDEAGCTFGLVLAGEQFGEIPSEFCQAMRRHEHRIIHSGFLARRDDYVSMMKRADLVISTSRHEFFGIAVQEAIHCGCHPLLPNRLSYPELIPKTLRTPTTGHAGILYDDEDELFETARSILDREKLPLDAAVLRQISAPLDWRRQARRFDSLFQKVLLPRETRILKSRQAPD